MAIYSCNLKSIGRTTHGPGTAGAHILYIGRPEAEPVMMSAHMPADPIDARNWIDRAERAARKNARMLDKIRIALPRELDASQRAELVQEYMADLTAAGPVPWFAAIHQSGKDADNPHVHIAVHDRSPVTGKRVLRLSDSSRDRLNAGLPGPKAVEWIRERWEQVCNKALERAGVEARIDRRTLEAQGVDREATIHVGPRAIHVDGVVRRPGSRRRVNGAGRLIDYPAIDRGKTRREFNAQIVDLNLERAARSPNPATAAWAAFEKEQLSQDRALEDRLAAERQQRTAQWRNIGSSYNARIKVLQGKARLEARAALRELAEGMSEMRDQLRTRQKAEREALTARHKGLPSRLLAALDVSGTARRRHRQAAKALTARHKTERAALSKRYAAEKQAAREAVRERYRSLAKEVRDERSKHLAGLRSLHRQAEREADILRQRREQDREQTRRITARKIQAWEKTQRETAPEGRQQETESRQSARARAIAKAKAQDKARGRTGDGGRGRTRGR